MKVKLKDGKMNKYNGLFRQQVKALNRGEVIEVDEIPKEAKPYLVEVGKKVNKKKEEKKAEVSNGN
tara:strand:+ start:348 stop:545 length:198 start_codon:yes stop_codon:yes gene_type:complete